MISPVICPVKDERQGFFLVSHDFVIIYVLSIVISNGLSLSIGNGYVLGYKVEAADILFYQWHGLNLYASCDTNLPDMKNVRDAATG